MVPDSISNGSRPGQSTEEHSHGTPLPKPTGRLEGYASVAATVVVILVLWTVSRGPAVPAGGERAPGGRHGIAASSAGPVEGRISAALRAIGAAPRSCAAAVALDEPGAVLSDLLEALDAEAAEDLELLRALDELTRLSRRLVGFEITDPSSIAAAGFDLSAPVTFAVYDIGQGGRPRAMVFGCGVSDEAAALKAARRLATATRNRVKEDRRGDPLVLMLDRSVAVAVSRGRLYLTTAGSRVPDPAQMLRAFIDEASREPLRDTEAFRAAAAGPGIGGQLALYVSLNSLLKITPYRDRVPLFDDLIALAVDIGETRAAAHFELAPNAELKELLRPGRSSRELLSKMDKPAALFTISLAEPVRALRYVLKSIGHEGGLARMDRWLEKEAGLSLDELGNLLRRGSGGIAIYVAPHEVNPLQFCEPFKFLVFAEVSDPHRARQAVRELVKTDPVAGHGDNPLYVYSGRTCVKRPIWGRLYQYVKYSVTIGVVNKYLVVGSATREIESLARGDGKGWDTSCGGTQLAAGEISTGRLFKGIREVRPLLQGSRRPVHQRMGESGRLTFGLDRRGEGICYTFTSEAKNPLGASLGDLFMLALPLLLGRRPDDRPGRASAAPDGPGRMACRGNLQRLWTAVGHLDLFRDQRHFPKSLTELWKGGTIRAKSVFVCPADSSPKELNGLKCSYESSLDRYPDHQFTDLVPGDLPFAWDRKPVHHGGRRGVCFFDGHIEFIADDEGFRHLMKQLENHVAQKRK